MPKNMNEQQNRRRLWVKTGCVEGEAAVLSQPDGTSRRGDACGAQQLATGQ